MSNIRAGLIETNHALPEGEHPHHLLWPRSSFFALGRLHSVRSVVSRPNYRDPIGQRAGIAAPYSSRN